MASPLSSPNVYAPLPSIHRLFADTLDALPWWDAPLHEPTAAQMVAEYVDEYAAMRARVSAAVHDDAYITPPQQDMPEELLEAAAVALLSQNNTCATTGPVRTPRRRAEALPRAVEPDTFFCCRWGTCASVFGSAAALTDHVANDHVQRRLEAYYCQWAGCKRAAHCFRQRDKIIVHLRLHTGDRRFRCEVPGCGREFSRADCFEEHRRVHSSVGRTEVCTVEGCGRSYYHGKSLRKHQRAAHGMVFSTDVVSTEAQLAAAALQALANQAAAGNAAAVDELQSLSPESLRPYMF